MKINKRTLLTRISILAATMWLNVTLLGVNASDDVIAPERDVMNSALPSGVTTLPDFDLNRKCVLKLSKGSLQRKLDVDARDIGGKEALFAAYVDKQIGDLSYDDAEGGVIVVWSRVWADHGVGKLSDLLKPHSVPLSQENLIEIEVGRRYLIQAVDKTYGLFRVLSQSNEGATIQWLHQPNGQCNFQSESGLENRPVTNFHIAARAPDSVNRGLAKHGLTVCYLQSAVKAQKAELKKISVQSGTVADVLKRAEEAFPSFRWHIVQGTSLVVSAPSDHVIWQDDESFEKSVQKHTGATSWRTIVSDLGVDKSGLLFPPKLERGRRVPAAEDQHIDPQKVYGSNLAEILARICWELRPGTRFEIYPSRRQVLNGKYNLHIVPPDGNE